MNQNPTYYGYLLDMDESIIKLNDSCILWLIKEPIGHYQMFKFFY